GNEFIEVRKNRFSYPHGPRVLHSTVDNAMTYASQLHFIAQPEQKRAQMLERSVMAQFDSFAPGLLGDDVAAGIFGDEPRGGKQAFKLAAKLQFQSIALHQEEGELHAG